MSGDETFAYDLQNNLFVANYNLLVCSVGQNKSFVASLWEWKCNNVNFNWKYNECIKLQRKVYKCLNLKYLYLRI